MKSKNSLIVLGVVFAVICVICIFLAVFFEKETNIPNPSVSTDFSATKASEAFSESIKYESPIDFASIKKESPDVFAWLNINGTDIDYPVAFHEGDNSYYLRRDIYGNYDRNGTLFIEDYNKTDFNDPVTIIYGHHMSSGAMFGKLQEIYTNPETFLKFNKITVYLPENELVYRVFCAVPLDNSHILYYHNFNNKLIFEEYFKEIYSTRSLIAVFDETVSITPDDRVLMLSTCFESDYSRRYVVMAVCEEDI
ncbi:MAG: class B sortase [Clostridia bacterium]|nr:class B sortase [Clostridia bacterium]